MGEFKFVLKCLLFTAFLMFISQYKWNDETIEAKAQYAFMKSDSSEWLREVAAGGVKFIRNTTTSTVDYVKNKMAHQHEPSKSY